MTQLRGFGPDCLHFKWPHVRRASAIVQRVALSHATYGHRRACVKLCRDALVINPNRVCRFLPLEGSLRSFHFRRPIFE